MACFRTLCLSCTQYFPKGTDLLLASRPEPDRSSAEPASSKDAGLPFPSRSTQRECRVDPLSLRCLSNAAKTQLESPMPIRQLQRLGSRRERQLLRELLGKDLRIRSRIAADPILADVRGDLAVLRGLALDQRD
jgi:hypothetical protein